MATLDGSTTAEIRPQVSGYIQEVNYKEGSRIDVGQLLFTLTGGTIESKGAEDPLMSRAGLEGAAGQYLGDHDRKDPTASPLYASQRRATPIQVHVGTAEVLLDDSLRLRNQDGVEVNTWEDMTHVFPSSVGLFEAAGAALDLIAKFLRAELAPVMG